MSEERSPGALKRQLGLADGIALHVGVILGSGIFVAPAAVAGAAPSPWAATGLWLFGGLVAACGALCYAECGARLPRSGGFFVFYREALSESLAVVAGWAAVLVTYPASVAAIAHVLSDYFVQVVPAAAPWRAGVAAGAVLGAGLLNAAGVRAGANAQRFLTATKLGALAVLLLAALASGSAPPPAVGTAAASLGPGALLAAIVVILWTYDGWSNVSMVAGELRDPARALGRTVLLGTGVLVAAYALVQTAVTALLPPDRAAASGRVVAEAVEAGLGASAGSLVAVLVVVSTFGAVNGVVLTASRLGFSMARTGVLPAWFGVVREGGAPRRATAGLVAATLVYVLVADFGQLLALFSFAVWIFYGLTAVALLRLRRRGVGEPLRWRAPAGRWPPLVVLSVGAGMTTSLFLDAPERSAAGLALLAGGFLAHRAWQRASRR